MFECMKDLPLILILDQQFDFFLLRFVCVFEKNLVIEDLVFS